MDTIEQLNLDIASTRAAIAHAKKVGNTLTDLVAQQKERSDAKYAAQRVLAKEESDVEQLEKLTLTSLIATITGKKEERLEEEIREAVAAKMRYDMACRDLEDITGRITALRNEQFNARTSESKLKELLSKKSALLQSQGGASGAKLAEIEEKLAKLRDNSREIAEAISAGNSVLSAITAMQNDLDSARNLGTWDMLGGGILVTMAKHERLDSAQNGAQNVQRALSRFRSELSDVSMDVNAPSVEVGSFLSFADYFFDGFFVDWAVQGKIDSALSSTSDTRYAVNNAMNRLKTLDQETKREMIRLEHERELILNGCGER